MFDRRTSYTVLQVFLPSYMIVLLSFMALWLPQDAVPARVALGITTVLTIVYFLGKTERRNYSVRTNFKISIDPRPYRCLQQKHIATTTTTTTTTTRSEQQ